MIVQGIRTRSEKVVDGSGVGADVITGQSTCRGGDLEGSGPNLERGR